MEVLFAFGSGDRKEAQTANTINRVVAIFPVKELRSIGNLMTSNLKVSSKQNQQEYRHEQQAILRPNMAKTRGPGRKLHLSAMRVR